MREIKDLERKISRLEAVIAAERLTRETSVDHTVNDVDRVSETDRREALRQIVERHTQTQASH